MIGPKILKLSKTLTLIAVSSVFAATVTAQQSQCKMKLDQLFDAPELRSFHLGMTYDQVRARVPQIQFGRADQFGVAKTSINPYFDPRFDKASLADVRTISLDFLDGQLVTLWIGYDSTFKWHTLDEFVNGMTKSLGLPAAWSPRRGGQQLTCNGFSVFAAMIADSPSVRLTNDEAQETIATRREEAAAAADAAESAVIGDKRTKLYYPSDCPARQSVTEPNRITFKDAGEAEKAGYKLARDCQ